VPPSVLAVILNWNDWESTLAAVDCVLRQNYKSLSVLVVDNGSTDGSLEHLRSIRDDRVEVLALPENRGYTGGCNEGFKRALEVGASYVWLFNNDAVAAEETLISLVKLAESDPKIGLVSPTIAELSEDLRLTFCGGILSFDDELHEATSDPEEARRWALQYPNSGIIWGTALLVKTSAMREIGMLDEKFFAYHEDDDYSYRSSQAGYRNLVDENSVVRHPTKNATLDSPTTKPHVLYYLARNHTRFLRKHLGVVRALKPCWWMFHSRLRLMLKCKENPVACDAILAGLWHGWINRGGPSRPEYRMPRLLAAAIWRYALARPALLHSVVTVARRNDTH